jgi:hypothetical protein
MKKTTRGSKKKSELGRTRQTTRGIRKAGTRKTGIPSKVSVGQKSGGVNRSEGIRLFKVAGRPSKDDFVAVYGPNGPRMTWEQRAAAGVPAEKFQAALASAMRHPK